MIWRVWTAFTVEVGKALRQKQTYVGPSLVLLVVLCAPLVHPVTRDGRSDYAFIAYVTPLALNFLGFLLLLTYSAGLVSSELNNGTIRLTLTRPLHRHEYILAKLFLGMAYAVALTALVAAASWAIGLGMGDLVGVHYGGELVYTAGEMRQAYALGALLGLAPQWAAVAFALMLSTCTRSPVSAVSCAVGGWILVDLVKYPLKIESFVFTTYLEKPWLVFIRRCDAMDESWFPMTYYCLGSSAAVLALCTGVAVYVLQRRNLSA